MTRVVVRARREGEASRDLEVPAELPMRDLTGMVVQALQWEREPSGQVAGYVVRVEPSGRVLQPYESLADARAWDGTRLLFQRMADGEMPGPDQGVCTAFLESETERKYPLLRARIRVGRSLPDHRTGNGTRDLIDLGDEPRGKTVSRYQALLEFQSGTWVLLAEPHTENPTIVNGTSLPPGEEHTLTEGDQLQFGGVALRFCLS